jgi:non-ribosomal peptide synthetase component F
MACHGQSDKAHLKARDDLGKERQTLLHEFNHTYADYPADRTLHELFEEQAERTPDRTALIYRGRRMTYGALNARANALAHTLRSMGVGPDTIVGL